MITLWVRFPLTLHLPTTTVRPSVLWWDPDSMITLWVRFPLTLHLPTTTVRPFVLWWDPNSMITLWVRFPLTLHLPTTTVRPSVLWWDPDSMITLWVRFPLTLHLPTTTVRPSVLCWDPDSMITLWVRFSSDTVRTIKIKEILDTQKIAAVVLKFEQCGFTIWAVTWGNQQSECTPREDSDQLGHLPSLIRVFAVHLMGS